MLYSSRGGRVFSLAPQRNVFSGSAGPSSRAWPLRKMSCSSCGASVFSRNGKVYCRRPALSRNVFSVRAVASCGASVFSREGKALDVWMARAAEKGFSRKTRHPSRAFSRAKAQRSICRWPALLKNVFSSKTSSRAPTWHTEPPRVVLRERFFAQRRTALDLEATRAAEKRFFSRKSCHPSCRAPTWQPTWPARSVRA